MKQVLRLSVYCFLGIAGKSLAQSVPPPALLPPAVTAVTPDAAALGKFGTYPVELSRGLPTIEVPVYTIKSRQLEVPVKLSYHASGIRVEERASNVGLGWSVTGGGVLTRAVRGLPDETTGRYYSYSRLLTQQQIDQVQDPPNSTQQARQLWEYLDKASRSVFDTEKDVYTYYAPGVSGSFRYDTNGQLCQIPLTDNRIVGQVGSGFTITNAEGTSYQFGYGATETTTTSSSASYTRTICPTTFHLLRMISADKTDTIYFDYRNVGAFREARISNSYIVYNGTPGGAPSRLQPRELTQTVTNKSWVLERIRFSGGSLRFVLVADRLDSSLPRLQAIEIRNPAGALLRRVQLYQRYFVADPVAAPDTRRLRLDRVVWQGAAQQAGPRYAFQYDTTHVLPPYPTFDTTRGANPGFGQDVFGYYNGVRFNQHLLPVLPPIPGGNPVNPSDLADRHVDSTYAQAGILTRMTVPTGGYSVFTYQSNRTYDTAPPSGGLRIRRIASYASPTARPLVTSYRYGPGLNNLLGSVFVGDDGSYLSNYWVLMPCYSQGDCATQGSGHWTVVTIARSFPALTPSLNNDNGVFYSQVTEYQGSVNSASLGKTEYEYTFEVDYPYFTNVRSDYPLLDGNNQIINRFPVFFEDMNWARGPLLRQTSWRAKAGGYELVREIRNMYTKYNEQERMVGTNIFKQVSNGLTANPANSAENNRRQFQYFDVNIRTGVLKLTGSTVINYDSAAAGAPQTTTTTYAYEALQAAVQPHQQLTRTEEATSAGPLRRTLFRYGRDKASLPGLTAPAALALDSLVARNQLSVPVEQQTFLGPRLLTTQRTTYQLLPRAGATLVVPASSQQAYGPAPLEPKTLFDQWDAYGNLLGEHAYRGLTQAYQWGYNKRYLVAKVRNAQAGPPSGFQPEFFYENFEESSAGSSGLAYTGAASSDGNGYTVPFDVPNARAYVLDWRQWDAGTQQWVYHQEPYAGPRTFAFGERLDDVRVYPADAQMTTYAYAPLVGMTAQTGPDGRTIFYEYDGLGRLVRTRDEQGHVLTQQQYHYPINN